MAANEIVSIEVAKAKLDAIDTALGSAATLRIFSGAIPDDCADTPAGSTLVTLTAGASMFGAASGAAGATEATMALSATLTGTVSTGGTAAYFRLYDSGGDCHLQNTVGASGSGEALELTSTTLVATETVDVTTLTLTQPTGE